MVVALLAVAVLGGAVITGPAADATLRDGRGGGGGGVLTWGADLTGQAAGVVALDPAQALSFGADFDWQRPVYDSLLRQTGDSSFKAQLALEATVVDPQTIDVVLREGVEFSDGTPFDARAVEQGIQRNLQAPRRGQFRGTFYDLASIDVTGPTSLRLHLSAPSAGAFYPLLAGQETFIMSPTAVAQKSSEELAEAPVGAGPFRVDSYAPGQRIVLVKNPGYWNAEKVKLSGITFVNQAGGPARLNALRAGTIDFLPGLALSDLPVVRSDRSLVVRTEPLSNSALWFPLCKSRAPLDDVRVRQALNYALDRDAIIDALLDGNGEPMWQLWPAASANYAPGLDRRYAYNPKKAAKLLAAAGHPDGVDLELIPIPGQPLLAQLAEVAQAQWAEVGIRVSIVQSTDYVGDLYQRQRADMGLNPSMQPGVQRIISPYGPGNLGNLCGYDDPALNTIAARLGGLTPGSPESVDSWREAEQLVVGDALSVWVTWTEVATAWNKRVTGVKLMPGPYFFTADLTSLAVRSSGRS